MKGKYIAIVVFAVAVLTAAIAGIVCMNKREAIARAARDQAEAIADTTREAARKAEADQATAAAQLEIEKKTALTAEENRKAAEAKLADDQALLAVAAEKKAQAEADRDRAKAAAQEASDRKTAEKAQADAAKLALDKAKVDAQKEELKAQAAADALAKEKTIADRIIAEAKLIELKRIDFENLERDLFELKRELDEREAALRPEKTIKDLATTGAEEEESKAAVGPKLPENDMSLSRGSRQLARAERERSEGYARRAADFKAEAVASLERLYVRAVREDRMTEADFYKNTLKSLYPGWEYKPPQKDKEEEKK